LAVRRRSSLVSLAAPSMTEEITPNTLGLHGQVPSARSTVTRIVGRIRGRHLLVVDLAGILVASYLALALRYDNAIGSERFLPFPPGRPHAHDRAGCGECLVRAVQPGLAFPPAFPTWNESSRPSLPARSRGSWSSTARRAPWSRLGDRPARSFWLAEILISGTVLGGARFAIRAASDWLPRVAPVAVTDRRATLFYGAGRTGVLMARSARRKPDAGVVPVGFLDDDPNLFGGVVANLRVFGGLEALDRAIGATSAEALLITMPSATGDSVRRVVDAAMARGLDVRTVPSLNDLLDGTLDAYRVRRVQVEDLLRRTTGTEHAAAVHEIIRDRTC